MDSLAGLEAAMPMKTSTNQHAEASWVIDSIPIAVQSIPLIG